MDGTPLSSRASRPAPTFAARIATILATCVAVLACAPAARAALPPQGLYDQCSPAASGDACASRLATMGGAGFKLVLNYTSWDATPEQLGQFITNAENNGMQAIWPLNHPVWRNDGVITKVYPKLAAACGCTVAHDLLAYLVGLVSQRGGTWGWYVGDELTADQLPATVALQARIKALDPNHPTFYVAYEGSRYNGDNLRPFAAVADVVGTDNYAYGSGADATAELTLAAKLTRTASQVTGRKRAMVLQAMDWSLHPDQNPGVPGGFPTRDALRSFRDTALTVADPSMILWYSYAELLKTADPAGNWANLVAAAFSAEPTSAAAGAAATTEKSGTTAKAAAAQKAAAKKTSSKAKRKAKKAKKTRSSRASRKATSRAKTRRS